MEETAPDCPLADYKPIVDKKQTSMKMYYIVRLMAVFRSAVLVEFSLIFTCGVVAAQSNGISSEANRLSSTAGGISDSATGLNRGVSEGATARTKTVGEAAAGSAASVNSAGSAGNQDGELTSGPCGEAYRKARKLGQKPGSRLGCE